MKVYVEYDIEKKLSDSYRHKDTTYWGVFRPEKMEDYEGRITIPIPCCCHWFEKGDVLIFLFHHDSSAIYKVVMKHPLKFIDEGVWYYELELF